MGIHIDEFMESNIHVLLLKQIHVQVHVQYHLAPVPTVYVASL